MQYFRILIPATIVIALITYIRATRGSGHKINIIGRVVASFIAALIVFHTLFVLILPWGYLNQKAVALDYYEKGDYESAKYHFEQALLYRYNLGVILKVFELNPPYSSEIYISTS